jgi:hypothetical protein
MVLEGTELRSYDTGRPIISYVPSIHLPALSPPLRHAYAAAPFPFSCASSFRLAARIISSFLFCIFFCLSFLSWLHALAFGCSSATGSTWLNFEDRLYRVIRSGCAGFADIVAARRGVAAGVGVGIWKDGGA